MTFALSHRRRLDRSGPCVRLRNSRPTFRKCRRHGPQMTRDRRKEWPVGSVPAGTDLLALRAGRVDGELGELSVERRTLGPDAWHAVEVAKWRRATGRPLQ